MIKTFRKISYSPMALIIIALNMIWGVYEKSGLYHVIELSLNDFDGEWLIAH